MRLFKVTYIEIHFYKITRRKYYLLSCHQNNRFVFEFSIGSLRFLLLIYPFSPIISSISRLSFFRKQNKFHLYCFFPFFRRVNSRGGDSTANGGSRSRESTNHGPAWRPHRRILEKKENLNCS